MTANTLANEHKATKFSLKFLNHSMQVVFMHQHHVCNTSKASSNITKQHLQYHVVEQDAWILDRDKLEKRERLAHSCMPASAKSSLIGAAGAPRLGQRMSPGQVACAQI
jgi:hypothetical protein